MKKIIFIFALLGGILLFDNVYAASNNTISFDGTRFYAIRKDNSLWVWQSEDEEPEKVMDNVVGINQKCIMKDDGTLWYYDEIPIKLSDDVYKASAYSSYVFFIKNDKTLYYMDLNTISSKCVSIKLMNNVYDVQLGSEHCIILKTDGSVWTIGNNLYGQLGVDDKIQYSDKPMRIHDDMKNIFAGQSASIMISADNASWMCGTLFGEHTHDNRLDKYIPVDFIKDIKEISIQYRHVIVLKTDNTLWQYSFADRSDVEGAVATKIADDINCISEWSDSPYCTTLFLKNNGELYVYNLKTGGYILTKIADNIRIGDEKSNIESLKTFADISNKTEEMQTAINALFKAGIVEGTGETEFSPDKPITRAEIAALLLWISAKTDIEDNGGFTDVTEDKWYYHTAGTSKKHGIVLGFEDNTFRGDEPVSKLQMVSLTSRVLRNESVFVDEEVNSKAYANIPDWAVEDIALAEQEGLISAEKDLISLNEDMTRGEAAVILYRLYNKI